MPPTVVPCSAETCSVQTLQDRVANFQVKHFSKQSLDGRLQHLIKETNELHDNPLDNSEWADVFLLYLAAAWKNGMDVAELVRHAHAKCDVNEGRQWHHVGNDVWEEKE